MHTLRGVRGLLVKISDQIIEMVDHHLVLILAVLDAALVRDSARVLVHALEQGIILLNTLRNVALLQDRIFIVQKSRGTRQRLIKRPFLVWRRDGSVRCTIGGRGGGWNARPRSKNYTLPTCY